MPRCLYCKKELPMPLKRKAQKFCSNGDRCRTAFWNQERTSGMLVPECFRETIQELADGQEITVKEMIANIISRGLKWEERGQPLTDAQIFGKEK